MIENTLIWMKYPELNSTIDISTSKTLNISACLK